ncbi:MAG TPA: HigA family addiction module antitoxin [Gammaproteobacteria bacterium]|nr:HigA family addiction module antitoxin [Gammaproteobacteria bacterium]
MAKLAPIHPGEILQEEFLKPMKISQYRIAKDIGISATRISEIVRGKRAITAETALRLSLYFGMSKGFWLGLQKRYELDIAEDALSNRLKTEVHPYKEAS